jgi:hypothetical protein
VVTGVSNSRSPLLPAWRSPSRKHIPLNRISISSISVSVKTIRGSYRRYLLPAFAACASDLRRHGRARPGHPRPADSTMSRTCSPLAVKLAITMLWVDDPVSRTQFNALNAWMTGSSPAMTGLEPSRVRHMLRTHLSNSYRYKRPIRYRQSFRHRQRLHWAPAVDHFGAASLGPLLRGRRPRRHPFASAKQASPLMGSVSGRAFLSARRCFSSNPAQKSGLFSRAGDISLAIDPELA